MVLSEQAKLYSWRQIARRVGLAKGNREGSGFEELGISLCYDTPSEIAVEGPSLIVVPCGHSAGSSLITQSPNTLHWLEPRDIAPPGGSLPLDERIPVLFWGAGYEDGTRPIVQRGNCNSIVFYADLVAATFFMLSRWEETVIQNRDEHGRFPATASVAYKQGFLNRPIVDEYALILREWLKVLLPNWTPNPRQFTVKLSHDIDRVQRFPSWRKGLRTFGGDLIKRRNLRMGKESGIGTLARIVAPSWDRYFQGIQALARVSDEHGLNNDAFYFMAADHSPYDSGYDPASPPVRRRIEDLMEQGFELGLHPSYGAFDDPLRLAEEKARMDAVLGTTVYGGRQHYLRFRVPDTWRQWEQVGLTYDATMAYAEYAGFRCGTCFPFRPFDIEQDRVVRLWERPLIAMDRTFEGYQQCSPVEALGDILHLARKCRQVGGEFTLLWHNKSEQDVWSPTSSHYQQIVKTLAQM